MTKTTNLSRRHFMATTAATSLILGAGRALAAEPIKTAGLYTVPVEQQWVSRIYKAALETPDRGDLAYSFPEDVSNTD